MLIISKEVACTSDPFVRPQRRPEPSLKQGTLVVHVEMFLDGQGVHGAWLGDAAAEKRGVSGVCQGEQRRESFV